MASSSNWRNKHPVPPNAILFFKIILRETLQDAKLKMPNKFTRKYGGRLSNPIFLNPPDGTKWEVYWTQNEGGILFEKGWKEFATHYSLDHGHLVLFEYKEPSHFEVHIFDMTGFQIEYPYHGTQDERDTLHRISEKQVEVLDEVPPTPSQKNTRLKSTMSSPRPHKKLRISYNLQNLPQPDQINGNQIPSLRKNPENSTFASIKREFDHNMSGTAERRKAKQHKNPSIMVVMRPSYVSHSSLNIPSKFVEKYLKKNQGDILLQVLDGRTWPVVYSKRKFNAGWRRFALDNNLSVGDACVFEPTKRKFVCFKVSILRASQEPSRSLSQVQGDGVCRLDLGRLQHVESKTDIIKKGEKVTQRTSVMMRTSMVMSSCSQKNGAMEEAMKFTSENPFFIVRIRETLLGQCRPVRVYQVPLSKNTSKMKARL